ncbi:hypothetical protein ACLBWZ_04945 [Brucellaceae bacterium C25G]
MSEDGLLEQLQNVYLALAVIAFLIAGLRHKNETRMFYIGMSWLMVLFFFRELEIKPVGPISSYFDSHAFRWHEGIVTIIFAGIYIWLRPQFIKPIAQYVFSAKCWPYYLAAFLLIMGEVFEKYLHQLYYNQFFEEMSECLGYIILLALAVRAIIKAPSANIK